MLDVCARPCAGRELEHYNQFPAFAGISEGTSHAAL